jgi:FAD-dependent urate hydroxylase
MSRPSTNGIVIVGAGPYGLSVAAHLRRYGLPFRIFGSPMQTWRSNMPAGMFLKSEGRASSLSEPSGSYTLRSHCEHYGLSYGEHGVPVPLETFSDYGLKFQLRFVPDVEDTRVLALHRSSHGYELQTATGSCLRPRAWSSPSGSAISGIFRGGWPICPESWSRTRRTIGASARSPAGTSRSSVAGSRRSRPPRWPVSKAPTSTSSRASRGWSGTTCRSKGLVHWRSGCAVRRLASATAGGCGSTPIRRGAFHRLPERMRVRAVRTALGPAGAWWLKERVLGQLPVLTGHTVLSAEADGDRLRLRVQRDDGRVIDQTTEHLIAGTGYRVDLSRLSFLGDQLRWRLRLVAGAPALSSSFEASAPDLYFVGLASAHSFGPAMRFLYGADYSARRLVRHLLARAAGAPFLAPAVRWSMVPSTQFALWSGSPRVGDDGMTDEYKASIL